MIEMRTDCCLLLLAALAGAAGCGRAEAPLAAPSRGGAMPATSTAAGSAAAARTSSASPPSSTRRGETGEPATGAEPRPCGELGCQTFPSAEAAFAYAIRGAPRVVAIGEAHSLKGTEAIASTVSRFGRSLLPLLAGRASALVLELMIPPGQCEEKKAEVRERQQVVTEKQARTNQNEYVELGHRARALDITPYPLRPTCQDLARIAAAGDDAVVEMLRTIAGLTIRTVRTRLAEQRDPNAMVVVYGGALHNDRLPREGREAFSFGPQLSELAGGRYVEIDLIVPEFIRDSESWRAFDWYEAFDPKAHPERATLFNPRPGAYALIFPMSDPERVPDESEPHETDSTG